jgi:hypothetical protein
MITIWARIAPWSGPRAEAQGGQRGQPTAGERHRREAEALGARP